MFPIQTILHPTDFSAPAADAFGVACSLARDHGARILVLHVAHQPPPLAGENWLPSPVDSGAEDALREALHQVRPPGDAPPVEHALVSGDPATAIVDLAHNRRCDLIVMGTHGRTGLLDRLLLGSVAETVVRRAPCPVLTVKAHQGEPAEGRAP